MLSQKISKPMKIRFKFRFSKVSSISSKFKKSGTILSSLRRVIFFSVMTGVDYGGNITAGKKHLRYLYFATGAQ